MFQFVHLWLACAVAHLASAASPGLSHVVRVGRNGRQVVHSKGGPLAQGKRRVVRRKQNRPRQSRQFLSAAPPAAPLTFPLPPAPAPVSTAPAAFTAFDPFRIAPLAPTAPLAPAVRVAPLRVPSLRVAPVAAPLRVAPVPAPLRVAPLPLVAHVSHLSHPSPLPVVAPPPVAAPAPVVAPAPAVVVEARNVPVQREYGAPVTVAPEVRNNYLAPAEEVVEVEAAKNVETGYLSPAVDEVEVEEARNVEAGYLAPQESYLAVPETTVPSVVEVVEAKNTYIAALPSDTAEQYVPRTKNVKPDPINIISFRMNSPAERKEFDYSFEADNGHKQEASGTMKRVDDTDVAVMKGSYEYVGADGLTYVVEWYADETGFHPSAPHLPQSVQPNHPEVAAAVRAQLEFAAQEDAAAAAASRSSNSYLAPEDLPGYNY